MRMIVCTANSIHTHSRAKRISASLSTKMLQEKCGLSERYATVEDVKRHAGMQARVLSTAEYQRRRVWGPVLEEEGKRVGALGEAASVCLNVMSLLPSSVLENLETVVPEAMQQKPDDTKESLKDRIKSHSFFEPAKVLKGMHGPQRVQLKDTAYPQPRRKSWSVIDNASSNFDAYMDPAYIQRRCTGGLWSAHLARHTRWRRRERPAAHL